MQREIENCSVHARVNWEEKSQTQEEKGDEDPCKLGMEERKK